MQQFVALAEVSNRLSSLTFLEIEMNELHLFLRELNTTEGEPAVVKTDPEFFQSELDEVRFNFVKEAKKQIDAIFNRSGRPDKYGMQVNSWSKELPDGRWKVTFKCGGHVMEMVEGKSCFTLPDADAACKFIAKAASAADRKLLDPYLKVKKATKKCRRRSKSEPPRRLNIEPGVEADFERVGCG